MGHTEDVDKDGLGLAGLERMSGGTRGWDGRTHAKLEPEELCTCDEGGFVGAAGLVLHLAVLELGDDGVADGEEDEKLDEDVVFAEARAATSREELAPAPARMLPRMSPRAAPESDEPKRSIASLSSASCSAFTDSDTRRVALSMLVIMASSRSPTP